MIYHFALNRLELPNHLLQPCHLEVILIESGMLMSSGCCSLRTYDWESSGDGTSMAPKLQCPTATRSKPFLTLNTFVI